MTARPTAAVSEPPRRRDRAATERGIEDAAAALLCEFGFTGLGINPLAERAGVDKQLIYRYFGGIDGVVESLAGRLDLWLPGTATAPDRLPATYAALMADLLDGYVVGLRDSRLVQRLLAWELVQPSATLARLEAVRGRAVGAWLQARKGTLAPPADVDAPAINALLLAGIHYLVLREVSVGGFASLDLLDPDGWTRIRKAARDLIGLAYREPGAVPAREAS
jgi:AcrR family transcriptional regulator